jgi:hypothetical protein
VTRYYLDTEFIDDSITRTIELISIGIVCEDGRELYAVSNEFDVNRCDDWLKANVLNQLPPRPEQCGLGTTSLWMSRKEIKQLIEQWIVGDDIEIWAYFASSDWIVFYQLFGRMLDMPKRFPKFVRDLKTFALDIGYTGKFKDLLPDTGHHDALADARWNRDVHQLLLQRCNLDEDRHAAALTDKLLADLNDRAGFSVDSDAREMIRPDWIEIIREAL